MNCENSTRRSADRTRPDRAAAGAPRDGAARAGADTTWRSDARRDAPGRCATLGARDRPGRTHKQRTTLAARPAQIATAIYIQIDRAVHVRSTRSQITPHAVRRVDCGWDGKLTSSLSS